MLSAVTANEGPEDGVPTSRMMISATTSEVFPDRSEITA
jgi:hypothetical protein